MIWYSHIYLHQFIISIISIISIIIYIQHTVYIGFFQCQISGQQVTTYIKRYWSFFYKPYFNIKP